MVGMGIDLLLGVGIHVVLYMIYPQKDFYCRPLGHKFPTILKDHYYKDSHFLL
jgi:hypothetical protein